jgi:hypothetical protein
MNKRRMSSKINYSILDTLKQPDGKQLYELTLTELEQIYENEKCRAGGN